MGAKSERTRNVRIKLVGGGYRMSRFSDGASGGSLKSQRRSLRHHLKNRKLTPESRAGLKERLKSLLAQRDGR